MTMNWAMQTRTRMTHGFVEWRMELRSVSGLVSPLTLAIVIHELDAQPAGIEDERAVIPRVVAGPLSRRAVVAVAGLDRSTVEGVDGRVLDGPEGPVQVLSRVAGDERERAALRR